MGQDQRGSDNVFARLGHLVIRQARKDTRNYKSSYHYLRRASEALQNAGDNQKGCLWQSGQLSSQFMLGKTPSDVLMNCPHCGLGIVFSPKNLGTETMCPACEGKIRLHRRFLPFDCSQSFIQALRWVALPFAYVISFLVGYYGIILLTLPALLFSSDFEVRNMSFIACGIGGIGAIVGPSTVAPSRKISVAFTFLCLTLFLSGGLALVCIAKRNWFELFQVIATDIGALIGIRMIKKEQREIRGKEQEERLQRQRPKFPNNN